MNRRRQNSNRLAALALVAMSTPLVANGQAPVDDEGQVIGTYESTGGAAARGDEDIPVMGESELEDLVGPIALYPDDLLAIVLPAATNPLQIIEAGRFLEELESDSSLEPNPEWDDSVVALLNYPEVVELMNEDIDWTWRLGEAVVAQQEDVVAAVEAFRDRAYAAGNLRSDDYQNVARNDGVIEITPVADDVIYVPYYEPERVLVYQPRPVYYYYPRAYPVYYYPYPSYHDFKRGFFWGVTTAFTVGWLTDSLHVYHHSYRGHPYFGYRYWDNWWYRRPSINVYNTTYVRNTNITINRYYGGDRWHPRRDRGQYIRETRPRIVDYERAMGNTHARTNRRVERQTPIRFRSRPETTAQQRAVMRENLARQRGQHGARPSIARSKPERGEPIARQRIEQREPIARQQADRRTPVTRQRTEHREPTVRQRAERREPVARQQAERRAPVARQRTEQREPLMRQPAERRESAVHRHVERRAPAARAPVERSAARSQPERATAKREESRPVERNAGRSGGSRRERGKAQGNTR